MKRYLKIFRIFRFFDEIYESCIRVVSKCISLLSVLVLRQSCKLVFYAALPHAQKQLRHSRNKKFTQKYTLVPPHSYVFFTVIHGKVPWSVRRNFHVKVLIWDHKMISRCIFHLILFCGRAIKIYLYALLELHLNIFCLCFAQPQRYIFTRQNCCTKYVRHSRVNMHS